MKWHTACQVAGVSVLAICATALELNGFESNGIWFVVLVWVVIAAN